MGYGTRPDGPTFSEPDAHVLDSAARAQLVPVQQEFSWGPLLLTAGAVGIAVLVAKAFETPAPVRRCGTCGKVGHDTRTCSQNAAKRVRLRIAKTGWCSCCHRRFRRTEAHHYAGPADGTKGLEMCGTCHLVCGHGGDWQNMGINPRYCKL
jgi:hypothetical protein